MAETHPETNDPPKTDPSKAETTDTPKPQNSNDIGFLNAATPLRAVFICNILFIAILELWLAPWGDRTAVANFLLLNFALGGAAGFAGGLLGFIFGVPRSLETPPQGQQKWGVNSNLVQISDWLTKLLVGASLASLAGLPGFAAKLVRYLDAGPYKGLPGGGTFALFILAFFSVLGFFWAYIETRTYLTKLLQDDDDVHPSAKV